MEATVKSDKKMKVPKRCHRKRSLHLDDMRSDKKRTKKALVFWFLVIKLSFCESHVFAVGTKAFTADLIWPVSRNSSRTCQL